MGSSKEGLALIGRANLSKSLKFLNLRAAGVDDVSVAHFIAHFPNLHWLDLEFNGQLTDAGAMSIARYGSPKLWWVGWNHSR